MSGDARPVGELVADHVTRIGRGGYDDRGEDANRILDRLHRGGPVEVLAPLFEADHPDCTKSLVFILSELGLRSVEAMGWLDALLDDPDEFVRHYAVVAVQHSGSLEHGPIIAKAISKVGDTRPVALAAVRFLAFGSLRQVATAVPHLDGDLGTAVASLVADDVAGPARTGARGDAAALVAVAAAARRRADGDPAPLDALMADDREPVADAARFVARFRPVPPQGRDILHRVARDDAAGG